MERKPFAKSNFLILGTAKDVASTIVSEVERLTELFSNSASVTWLIIESDSSDDTLVRLHELEKYPNFFWHSLGKLAIDHPRRTERLALCRNFYLSLIESSHEYSNIDYVVVSDLDGVNSGLTLSGIQSCWELDDNWDACFANQHAPYYDVWALRHDQLCAGDCWEDYRTLVSGGLKSQDAMFAAVWSRMVEIDPSEKAIEVDSAFGGFGIYKRDIVRFGRYVGVNQEGFEVCEHVAYHLGLRARGAKLFINPRLINGGWNEHSDRLKSYLGL